MLQISNIQKALIFKFPHEKKLHLFCEKCLLKLLLNDSFFNVLSPESNRKIICINIHVFSKTFKQTGFSFSGFNGSRRLFKKIKVEYLHEFCILFFFFFHLYTERQFDVEIIL